MPEKRERFRQTLDAHHQWPCPYIYKFIMPSENLHLFAEIFHDSPFEKRQSKSGKYTSVTMVSTMCSADEVMAVYEKAASVPGLMSL
ncbi:MAG: DUF493 family protein [Desulfovibrionaceae bacterium]|nr:DUF493 family protein [Desulfovibrionaceae bacterium]